MILLSLALFRAKQITGFITCITASVSHIGQCTGIERDAIQNLCVFFNPGAKIFFICRLILIVLGGCVLQLELLYHEIITAPADGLFFLVYFQMRGNVLRRVRKIEKSDY
jgi:hypothetical protein